VYPVNNTQIFILILLFGVSTS